VSASEIANVIAGLVLPPGGLILLVLGGLALVWRRPVLGVGVACVATLALYALATPFLATRLLYSIQSPYVDPAQDATGQAIVVLGGGLYPRAVEYGADTVSRRSLERVRYAARLHERTGKPILVAGGNPSRADSTEAEQMAAVLREFGVAARWLENASANTMENARHTRRTLEQAGISRIYLVTHAWHMPRARIAFEEAGFQVIPAATAYITPLEVKPAYLVPDVGALELSSIFFREIGGMAWYRLKSRALSDAEARDAEP
jgi:uncharacterized SAM-binding protein YcdF (DUF218 family)